MRIPRMLRSACRKQTAALLGDAECMDRFYTYEDYAYADRSAARKRFEVIDSVTNKVVGSFAGSDAEVRAQSYADNRNEGMIRA